MWQNSLIQKYKNNHSTFIETGTWKGDGINVALDVGFETVYSCDIDNDNINNAKQQFINKNVILHNMSSETFLANIIPNITKPALIWLDAHVMPDSTGKVFAQYQLDLVKKYNIGVCPLLNEIKTIFFNSSVNHTVLIDDYHCFGTWEFNFLTADEVKQLVLSFNPQYEFSVEDNVLCCFIKDKK